MLKTENINQKGLRLNVRKLAKEAFEKHLISGYGDSEYADKYQIVLEGKPRHYRLEYAYHFLSELLNYPS